MAMEENILEIRGISKDYPGVRALNNVSFNIKKNTVHCIIGENGAGKSTLIKILTGAIRRSAGTILFLGKYFEPKNIKESMTHGMSVLYQELNVVDQLSVAENLTLGIEERAFGIVRHGKGFKRIFDVLQRIAPDINLETKVADLSVGKKQMLEIVKAVACEASIIIMDEPTASISEAETQRFFDIIENIKTENVAVIYVSHRLSEVMNIGDFVTVLRDGMVVDTRKISDVADQSELIKMMLGKVVVPAYIPSAIDQKTKILEVMGISNEKLSNISFDLYKREILGFYGLVGSGKTEIARAIYGVDKREGRIKFHGKNLPGGRPRNAISRGIAMVPEERRTEGLFVDLTIRENMPVMNLGKISKWGITSLKKEKALALEFIRRMRIVARNEEHIVSRLSGGNQQKVVVSKCLISDCSLLLLDEPTRGVDVGAKEEIHNIIRDLSSSQGMSVIVFSSELPEILTLCDRVILLYGGKIRAEFVNGTMLDMEKIMHLATGGE